MVAIEHRQKSSTTATTITAATINVDILSPTSSASSASAASSTTTTTAASSNNNQQQQQQGTPHHKQKQHQSSTAVKMSASEESPVEGGAESKDRKAEAAIAPVSGSGGGGGTSAGAVSKSAVSQRNVDIQIAKKSNVDATTKELTKKVLKLDLTGKELDEYSVKSPKSPIAARLPHQSSLTSSVDVEDRKTLREALYQGIFHRHRRTIFAVGSFLRMLRSRNSQYNTIRSSSEGEDVDEVR